MHSSEGRKTVAGSDLKGWRPGTACLKLIGRSSQTGSGPSETTFRQPLLALCSLSIPPRTVFQCSTPHQTHSAFIIHPTPPSLLDPT